MRGQNVPGERIAYWDNLKAVLIILVVLGHMLEKSGSECASAVYAMIYSFHMPLFVFVSGFFFKKGANWVTRLFLPYVLLQLIHGVCYALLGISKLDLSLTTPHWTLWYLLSMSAWYMIAGVMNLNRNNALPILLISILLAVLVGYDSSVGNYLSLSRTVSMFPWFLGGIIVREFHSRGLSSFLRPKGAFGIVIRLIAVAVSTVLLIYIYNASDRIEKKWLYYSYSYAKAGYTPLFRMGMMLTALIVGLSVMSIIPDRYIPGFTFLGRRTLAIYSFHALIISVMKQHDMIRDLNCVVIVISAVVMTYILAFIPIDRRNYPMDLSHKEKKK
ncbi:MAG: acyltransferase family protein [Lachnospiraceae bacterium]|nr:acyltransferase family protein [Lachnospiraceae bacterium]